jgi:hypothetical protein
VNSVNTDPGGAAATAWPQCIFNNFGFANPAPTTLTGKLQAVVHPSVPANTLGEFVAPVIEKSGIKGSL